jgi:hypothetical protein
MFYASVAILAFGASHALAAHGGGHGGHHGGAAGAASSGSAAAGVGAAGSASAANGGSRGSMSAANGMHGGSLQPGAGFADTQIPWGSTDTSVQGGPFLGGLGGSTMQVSDYGKKSWPCYPAGQWAGSADFHLPAGCK